MKLYHHQNTKLKGVSKLSFRIIIKSNFASNNLIQIDISVQRGDISVAQMFVNYLIP